MAQHSNSELYSTLELVIDDPSANAPQYDHNVDAPEVNQTHDAPQVVFENGLEPFFDRSLPEVSVDVKKGQVDEKAEFIKEPKTYGIPKRTFWIAFAVLIAIVVIIAVGVGVGVGVSKKSSTNLSTTPTTTTPTPVTQGTSTSTASPHTTGTTNTTNNILNDTALSVLSVENGDLRLFFQDSAGLIKESYYTQSTGKWVAAVDDIVATNAKKNTPLASYYYSAPFGTSATYVYYIAQNNSLASRYYVDNSWSDDNTGISAFITSPKASLLTATDNDIAPSGVSLIYESVNGSLATLSGSFDGLQDNSGSWEVASQSLKSYLSGEEQTIGLTSTFTSIGYDGTNVTAVTIRANQSNTASGYTIGIEQYLELQWANVQEAAPVASLNANKLDITQVSLQTDTTQGGQSVEVYGLMVNDTTLEFLYFFDVASNIWKFGPAIAGSEATTPKAAPASPFPYAKLTSIDTDFDTFIIFHQINSTAFVEDEYNTTSGQWNSTFFSIET